MARGYSPQQAAALVASGAAPAPTPASGNPVDAAINATAAQAGMDPKYWRAFAHIESGLDPSSNYNKGTQYKGLFQIGSRGPQSEWATHGSGNIFDPMDNATAAAKLAARNNAQFKAWAGRDPTPAETYLMHQQGFGFFKDGTMTNIAGNLPARDRTPENMTHEGFQNYWTNRLERIAGMPEGSLASPSATPPPGGGGGTAAPSVSPPSTAPDTSQTADTSGGGVAQGLANVASQIAKSDQSNQMMPLQPLTMAQPMMTPAMYRARLMAQTMLANPVGGTTP